MVLYVHCLVRYLVCQDFYMVVLCFFLVNLSACFPFQPTLLFIYSELSLDNYGTKCYYPTALRRVQITLKTGTNITR